MAGDGSASEIERIRQEIAPGETIAFVSGNFNIVHPGHLRLLKFASEAGDRVVVGVQADSSPGVTMPAEMRLEGLRSNSLVQHSFLMTKPVVDVIADLKPDVVVKGNEFQDRFNPEKAAVEQHGGRLIFGSGEVRFSSLRLLHQEFFQTSFSAISKPQDFPDRHGFRFEELKSILLGFAGLRVLVVGDLIIDTYVTCEPLGMSQEEPTIVVTPIEERTFVGGAGIVALHARGLGADVSFISVVGNDDRATFTAEQFETWGARAELVVDASRPTTHKKRFRASAKSLLRVNDLRQHAIEHAIIENVLERFDRLLPDKDLLLFSDFNYGCLPQPLVDAMAERARSRGVMMVADSQASSQLADISRFRGMSLITPTEREARLAMQDFESGLVTVAQRLQKRSAAKHLIVTLGAEGLLIEGDQDGTTRTDRLPAFNRSPKDVAGAGDALFIAASMALCRGADIWRSAYLGSLAAACQTSRLGNTPMTVKDILDEIDYPEFGH